MSSLHRINLRIFDALSVKSLHTLIFATVQPLLLNKAKSWEVLLLLHRRRDSAALKH